MAEVRLLVNAREYAGWLSVRVTRSIEAIAGSFDLDITDRWATQDEPWPIAEGDACEVKIDDDTVVTGYVDRRTLALAADQRTLTVGGRDRAGQLVDCSCVLDQWTFRKTTVVEIARAIVTPFELDVSVQRGLVLPAPPKFTINPGETAFAALARLAQGAQVLLVSDGAGNVVFTRAASQKASALVQGVNVLAADVAYDASSRYHRYVVASTLAGSDTVTGAATRVRAEARDTEVRPEARTLLLRPASGYDAASARHLADWEARVRAARAETTTVEVAGWQQPDGALWPVNALVTATLPALGVAGTLLISEAEFSLGPNGSRTRLRLVRPDAFRPEPRAVVRGASGRGGWKELAGGAL